MQCTYSCFRCLFCIVWHGSLVYSKQFPSSVTETKLIAILFCLEMNSAGYPLVDEPIRLRKNHYPPARYMLILDIMRKPNALFVLLYIHNSDRCKKRIVVKRLVRLAFQTAAGHFCCFVIFATLKWLHHQCPIFFGFGQLCRIIHDV